MNQIQELLAVSKYKDFPDAVLTFNLCIAFAKLEKRNVDESLRTCARRILPRMSNLKIRQLIGQMSVDPNPMVGLTLIDKSLQIMEDALLVGLPRMNVPEEYVQRYIDLKGQC